MMHSNEHILFLKKKKKEKVFIKIIQISIIVLFIILWQTLTNLKIINKFIFSSPLDIINTIIKLLKSNDLFHHIYITTIETIISFTLSTIIGIIVASFLWYKKIISKIIDPYLTVLNSLPKVALGPIIIIWCGAGFKSIILMALLISLIITIINIHQGFISVDSNKIKLMKSMHATNIQIYFKLLIPSNINNIISTLKVNISMSLIGVTMGELLVSKEGLGYLIMYGSQVFNLHLVMTGVLLLCILSTIMYYLVCLLEKKIIKG